MSDDPLAPSPTPAELRQRILMLLTAIAPDIDPSGIDPGMELRDQFDFDSMDRLHFAVAIAKEFQIDIPESDYAQLAALDRACAYVADKLRISAACAPRPSQ